MSTGWLIGVARHKLADHWRRQEREQRSLRLVHNEAVDVDDPWDAEVDAVLARQVLDQRGAHHRAALTLQLGCYIAVDDARRALDFYVEASTPAAAASRT